MGVMLLVGLAATTLATGENLIPNGGFEDARKTDLLAGLPAKTRAFYDGTTQSALEGWTFGGRWEGGDYGATIGDEARSGKHSCQITCRTRGRGGIGSAPIKLKPGTIIRASLWIKAKDASGGRIFLNFEGSPGDGWASKDLKTGTYDWTRFTKLVTVPGGKPADEQTIVVFLYMTTDGSIWIDDFSVEVVDPAATAPAEESAAPRSPKPIPESPDSPGYRVGVVSAMEKVFREDDYCPTLATSAEVESARNEYESIQLVVEAPWRPVTIKEVKLSDLAGPGGAVIPASAMTWNRVEYVQTTVEPPYYTERGLGWYPDPLVAAGEFSVQKLSRCPVWITLKTPKDCPAGLYSGTVTVVPDQLKPVAIPLRLIVWDFALSDRTHLRTLTWLGTGILRGIYGNDWSPEGERRHAQVVRNYEDVLLEHRLGPGGEVAANVYKGKDGKFDFTPVDRTLGRLIPKGMNAFIMGTAPNLRRAGKKEYAPEFVRDFSEMTRAYADHLREKGWLDLAYVYTYDEAPREAWPEVKKIAKAVKEAAPGARILQCLNQPEGVRELTGFIDVFDVYVTQYHRAGVASFQKKGGEVWLAVCCYPMDHPNFFLEYPLLDLRATPWICWKHGAAGFEYWSPNAWGANAQKKADIWPKSPWVANTFGKYNGDGYLTYPGPNGTCLSSIRFEALRDGLEDYEYLWTLDWLLKQATADGKTRAAVEEAKKLLSLGEIVKDSGAYSFEPERYAAHRRKLAAAIVSLQAPAPKAPPAPRP
jgi:hypothetical protein